MSNAELLATLQAINTQITTLQSGKKDSAILIDSISPTDAIMEQQVATLLHDTAEKVGQTPIDIPAAAASAKTNATEVAKKALEEGKATIAALPSAPEALSKTASDAINTSTAALKTAGTALEESIKSIPTGQLKEEGTAALSTVVDSAKKASAAAVSIVEKVKGMSPEIIANAEGVAKSITEAITKVEGAPDAAKAASELSMVLTKSASSISGITREVSTYAASLDPAAAAELKSAIGSIATSSVEVAKSAAGAVQGMTTTLGPVIHSALLSVGAASLASPALPIIAGAAAIVMIIMRQKQLHSALVSKMNGYFTTLLQMMEIFHIMSIIGSKMSYSIDANEFVKALNAFNAYLYLAAPPSLRKEIEKSGENKDSSGKITKISWFQKTTGKLQRVLAPSSMLVKLDSLFNDVITFFLLSISKFNIVTSIHGDVLQSMKSDILKLDEIIKFFNKIDKNRTPPTTGPQTDDQVEKKGIQDANLLEDAIKKANIPKEAMSKNLVQLGETIAKVEEDTTFKAKTEQVGMWGRLFGTKKSGGGHKKKRRTKRLKRRV